MHLKEKSRPIAAGGPFVPMIDPKSLATVPEPIVSSTEPKVKWLESLRAGDMFTAGDAIFEVIGLARFANGRIITLGVSANAAAVTNNKKPEITNDTAVYENGGTNGTKKSI